MKTYSETIKFTVESKILEYCVMEHSEFIRAVPIIINKGIELGVFDKDCLSRLDYSDAFRPCFVFREATIYADEMWWLNNDKVETSSWNSGLLRYLDEEKSYVREYLKHDTILGDMIEVRFPLDEDLKKLVESLS